MAFDFLVLLILSDKNTFGNNQMFYMDTDAILHFLKVHDSVKVTSVKGCKTQHGFVK